MIIDMDDTEASIGIFDDAVKKTTSCSNVVQYSGTKVCKLFFFRLDTSVDMLAVCSSCKANTKKPTTSTFKARFN